MYHSLMGSKQGHTSGNQMAHTLCIELMIEREWKKERVDTSIVGAPGERSERGERVARDVIKEGFAMIVQLGAVDEGLLAVIQKLNCTPARCMHLCAHFFPFSKILMLIISSF